MARSSMADLITRLRLMVNDPSASAVWTDNQLQDALDEQQTIIRYMALTPVDTISGGSVTYVDYTANVGSWETDEVLVNGSWATLTPATADRLTGRWTFSTSKPPPVMIVGKLYNVPAAAITVCRLWAAKVAAEYDYSDDTDTHKRSQKQVQYLKLAEGLAEQAATQAALINAAMYAASGGALGVSRLVRSDL